MQKKKLHKCRKRPWSKTRFHQRYDSRCGQSKVRITLSPLCHHLVVGARTTLVLTIATAWHIWRKVCKCTGTGLLVFQLIQTQPPGAKLKQERRIYLLLRQVVIVLQASATGGEVVVKRLCKQWHSQSEKVFSPSQTSVQCEHQESDWYLWLWGFEWVDFLHHSCHHPWMLKKKYFSPTVDELSPCTKSMDLKVLSSDRVYLFACLRFFVRLGWICRIMLRIALWHLKKNN